VGSFEGNTAAEVEVSAYASNVLNVTDKLSANGQLACDHFKATTADEESQAAVSPKFTGIC
jgi:iron complex outermembrane receptor protein